MAVTKREPRLEPIMFEKAEIISFFALLYSVQTNIYEILIITRENTNNYK